MKAIYRLSSYFPTFEFFCWLVMVKAQGATEIIFDTSTPKLGKEHTWYGLDNIMTRFHSIVEPGPALAGLPCRYFRPGDQNEVDATASQLIAWVQAGNKFERLQSVNEPVPGTYTVTIRDNITGSARGRDSRKEDWRKFAETIGARVIEDYAVEPMHLHDRFAIYAGAKMNFGVCNGPIHTLSLTEYPVTQVVGTVSARNSQAKWGMPEGQKFPWMLPNQHLTWIRKDLYDYLMLMFERWQRGDDHGGEAVR